MEHTYWYRQIFSLKKKPTDSVRRHNSLDKTLNRWLTNEGTMTAGNKRNFQLVKVITVYLIKHQSDAKLLLTLL